MKKTGKGKKVLELSGNVHELATHRRRGARENLFCANTEYEHFENFIEGSKLEGTIAAREKRNCRGKN